jgi:hypothetical protein
MPASRAHCPTRVALSRLGISIAALAIAPGVGAGVFDVDNTSTAQSLEVETRLSTTHSSDERTWWLPGLGVNGKITDNAEWSVGSGYGATREGDDPTRGGWHDVSISTKWRFMDHSIQGGIAMAVAPELTFPVGGQSSTVGAGAAGFALPVRVVSQFGRVRVTGQLRFERTFGRDEDLVDIGVLAEYAASDEWSYGVEFVADAPRKHLDAHHFRGNVGFVWTPTDRFELQMLAGRSLDNRRGAADTTFRLVLVIVP